MNFSKINNKTKKEFDSFCESRTCEENVLDKRPLCPYGKKSTNEDDCIIFFLEDKIQKIEQENAILRNEKDILLSSFSFISNQYKKHLELHEECH